MAAPQPPKSKVGFVLTQHEEDRTRRARILVGGSITLALLIALGTLLRHLLVPMPPLLWVPLASAVLIFGAAPLLYRFLGLVATGVIVPAVMAVAVGSVSYNQAGLATPMASALVLPPLIATLFGGRRAGLGVALLSGLILYWLYALELSGHAFVGMRMDSTQLARTRLNVLGIVLAIAAAIAWLYEHERVRRETRLREVQGRYELAIEGSEDGLFDLLVDSRTSLYSHAFKKLLGYAPDAELNTSLFELISDASALEASLRALREEGGHVDLELQLRLASGQLQWFQLRGVLVQQLTQARLVGSIRDISARKQAESLKDEFVATISHELRTPLTSIHGSLVLLEHTAADTLAPDARALLDISRRNTDRLRALVDDLLDVQRLEMGGFALTYSACDVGLLLKETLALNLGLEARHKVKLVQSDVPEGRVELDRTRIQQVLSNLISNACKFAPAGSEVILGASLSDDVLRLSVTDQGPGVPSGFEAKLFQRFSQADSSAVRAHSGTGLGLYISRRIVESHGGHIAYRREHAASVFELSLPVRPLMDASSNTP